MKKINFLISLCVSLLFFLPGTLYAQKNIKLIKSSKTEIRNVGGRTIIRVIGPVHYYVPERNLNIFCDATDNYKDEGLYILSGNVKFIDDEKRLISDIIRYNAVTEEAYSPGPFTYFEFASNRMLQADKGTYFYAENILIAEGNVEYSDSLRRIYADQLEYFEKEKYIDASGNIKCINYEQGAVATARMGKYREKEQYGILTGESRLAIADSAGTDSLFITGKQMEYFGADSIMFIVSDSVAIRKGKIEAYCQQAAYDADASVVYLRINPKIEHESTTIYGREIDLVIRDETLTEVVVSDSAIVLTGADTTGLYDLKNELKGKVINLYFDGENINKVVAKQNAESEYYSFDNNNELQWKNVSSCGEIVILFKNGYTNKIIYSPDVVGEIIPKSLLPEIKKKRLYE
ncbi:hypothetical protein AMJ80_06930 [bacterium SM23_31]|nr:MAG: hypothetical protein AMJ80_06930 [bacterium SM23_31]